MIHHLSAPNQRVEASRPLGLQPLGLWASGPHIDESSATDWHSIRAPDMAPLPGSGDVCGAPGYGGLDDRYSVCLDVVLSQSIPHGQAAC